MTVHPFGNSGWIHTPARLPASLLSSLVDVQDVCVQAVRSFWLAEKKIDVTRYDPAYLGEIEQAKAVVRVVLRYHPLCAEALSVIAGHIAEMDGSRNAASIRYLARPYIMMHLPEDESEKGGFHGDALPYINHFITAWAPIREYSHGQLELIPGSQRWPSKLRAGFIRLHNSGLPVLSNAAATVQKRLAVTPRVRQSDFLAWDGSLLHRGNLNHGSEIGSAMVFRLTDEPIMTEPARICSAHRPFSEDVGSAPPHEIAGHLSAIIASLGRLSQGKSETLAVEWDEVGKLLEPFASASAALHRALSFALAIYAQRLERHGRVIPIYMASLHLGDENLLSLARILDSESHSPENADLFAKRILSARPFRQHEFLVGEWRRRHRIPVRRESVASAPLMTW
jgi:hypothetical protein